MTERIEKILSRIRKKDHHSFRQNIDYKVFESFTESMSEKNLSDLKRAGERLKFVLGNEKPVILPDEKIAYMRTVSVIPEIFTAREWQEIKKKHYVHESGKVCNICPDYSSTIKCGLAAKRKEALDAFINADSGYKKEFLQVVIDSVDAVLGLAQRYAHEAENCNNHEVTETLKRIPLYGATTFYEALQFFRILHFALWASGNYHNTAGRFDQYMYPYLKADLDTGRLNYDQAFELLEEFFISFNRDSDLYQGMQQGDNGQSIVLGGADEHGNDAYNMLSEMCLKASLELKLIDPKINLRVNKDTKLEIYELGTELTRQGLGFPQYSNDDIIIEGLVQKGYSLEDARNYTVAACWEFIIPGVGMDIPNIGAVSFAHIVDKCVHRNLKCCNDFDAFFAAVKNTIQAQVNEETYKFKNIYMEPAPFMSVLMDGCIKNGKDISLGCKYNNYGLHGTGIATAADSMAAIRKYVFDKKLITAEEMVKALDSNYKGYSELYQKLKYDAPKMGNNDDYVDDLAIELIDAFAETLENKRNDRGGCYRAGTGSAMYYVWHAKNLGATPDSRKKCEFLSANYSPSLNIKLKGPVSILQSFAKPDLRKVVNGGPLTIEMHDTVLRDKESITKVALLVKFYMDKGGHQLQINTLNRDLLLKAQKNPEQYRNLIVRVWGWSGYFVELDKEYQDHIISRTELEI